jgi:hypothetical protein
MSHEACVVGIYVWGSLRLFIINYKNENYPVSWFFTCLGPGKVSWSVADVRSMAVSIRMGLPLSVAQIIGADTWKGGALVQLEDTLTRPVAQDIVVNYSWVKPFVQRFRSSVPSVFFVTDVFLFLDKLYQSKLLIPLEAGDSKQSVAGLEANKIKLLIGALRALWRSSTSKYIIGCFLFLFWACRMLHMSFRSAVCKPHPSFQSF